MTRGESFLQQKQHTGIKAVIIIAHTCTG